MVVDYLGATPVAVNGATPLRGSKPYFMRVSRRQVQPLAQPLAPISSVRKGAVSLLLGLVAGQEFADTRT